MTFHVFEEAWSDHLLDPLRRDGSNLDSVMQSHEPDTEGTAVHLFIRKNILPHLKIREAHTTQIIGLPTLPGHYRLVKITFDPIVIRNCLGHP